jgi:hypothetical protein
MLDTGSNDFAVTDQRGEREDTPPEHPPELGPPHRVNRPSPQAGGLSTPSSIRPRIHISLDSDARAGTRLDASRATGFAAAATEFPISLRDTIGETLHLVLARDRPRVGTWLREMWSDNPWSKLDLLLLDREIPVAQLRYDPLGSPLMDIACREEQWQLTTGRPHVWDVNLERSDGQAPLGCYRARRWRAGGIIELADGTNVMVRKPLTSHWHLDTPSTESFVEVQHRVAHMNCADEPLRVTMKSCGAPRPSSGGSNRLRRYLARRRDHSQRRGLTLGRPGTDETRATAERLAQEPG